MIRKRTTIDDNHRTTVERKRAGRDESRHPVGTGLGAAVGAAIVLAAAGAVGAGAVGFATSVAVGMFLGGWAGRRLSRERSRTGRPRDAVRRKRMGRILRITRTLHRRRVLKRPAAAHPRTFPRLMNDGDQIQVKLPKESIDASR
jgi:hypothetical protein